MNDQEFLEELRGMVVRRASASGLVDTLAFVAEVAERLEADPVFGEYRPVEYAGTGSRNRQLRVHGYSHDEADGTLGLVIGRWSDAEEVETLNTAAVTQLSSYLEHFVAEALKGDLRSRITEANEAYALASLLREAGGKIARIRLHILSNQALSQRYKEEIVDRIEGVPVERHIWDFNRLKALYESTREREAVRIRVEDYGSDGIPCIEAARTEKLRSYLCVIRGDLLANLFERFGSRLLEGNVRSFLGMKGGVNKGIRATIQDSPSLFFAYNNGIAATAAEAVVEDSRGTHRITELLDLQIVNGGQTTASVLNARKKDGLPLDRVTVQMKLTVVEQADANELIPKIAQYANTQNKIAVADFFANHPFHRKIEEISVRMQVPARPGVRVQSKWMYERARGAYQNARLYLTKAKKDAFDLEFPSGQVINKTELAKYDSTWQGKPHWASLGAQKNFVKFAGRFEPPENVSESEHWASMSSQFGDDYYQRIVAMAILWKRAESILASGKGDWYLGDYRPQIIAYALALLFEAARSSDREIDLQAIWQKQVTAPELDIVLQACEVIAQRELLSPPPGSKDIGEWSKKEACWDRVRSQVASVPKLPAGTTVGRGEFRRAQTDGRRQGQQDDGITLQREVLGLVTSGYWRALAEWPQARTLLTPSDFQLLTRAVTVQSFTRINTDREWRRLMDIRARCEDEGFRQGT